MKKLLTLVSSKDQNITTETFAAIRDYLKVDLTCNWLDSDRACEIYFDYAKDILVDELIVYFDTRLYDWAYPVSYTHLTLPTNREV